MTYYQKLKDPRWQKLRLEKMENAKWTCQMCGAKDRTFNVHHSFYKSKTTDPWDYTIADLICLCEQCHTERHQAEARFKLLTLHFKTRDLDAISVAIFNMVCSINLKPSKQGDAPHPIAEAINKASVELIKASRKGGK